MRDVANPRRDAFNPSSASCADEKLLLRWDIAEVARRIA